MSIHEEHVVRLHVPMHDVRPVSKIERLTDFPDQANHFLQGVLQIFGRGPKRLSSHERDNEEQKPVNFTGVEKRNDVETYRRRAAAMDIVSRKVGDKEKTGVFTGSYARNPATGEDVPVWVADYVLMEYGTGAIMAVPAHDERDFYFATKFELAIVKVIDPSETGPDG